ncbi:hypothetical protein AAVH_21737, partial [Aphelenchoides avenae]
EIEDNNPALLFAVPEHLRKIPKLMATVEANAKQLVTHFDTYATLWNGTLLGESYLYPFNLIVPRTCQNQRVPLEYCICQNRVK